MDDIKGLSELFALGGNSAAMCAVYLGWQAFKMMRETIERNTRATLALQRAVAALSPIAARIIDDSEAQETARLQKLGP